MRNGGVATISDGYTGSFGTSNSLAFSLASNQYALITCTPASAINSSAVVTCAIDTGSGATDIYSSLSHTATGISNTFCYTPLKLNGECDVDFRTSSGTGYVSAVIFEVS